MAFAIGLVVAIVVGALIEVGRARRSERARIKTEEERKRRESDELVAVVLPTIGGRDEG